jgi:hypothetical protein
MSVLGPFLNRRSDLSIRKEVLLYRQLIRPVMDYVCSTWRSAARTHVWRLQVLKCKCLRLATGASRYVTSRQIHEDHVFHYLPTTSEPWLPMMYYLCLPYPARSRVRRQPAQPASALASSRYTSQGPNDKYSDATDELVITAFLPQPQSLLYDTKTLINVDIYIYIYMFVL